MNRTPNQRPAPGTDEPVVETDDELNDLSEQREHHSTSLDDDFQSTNVGRPDNREA